MSDHTTGPWKAQDGPEECAKYVVDQSGESIAIVAHLDANRAKANTALIASAPDLAAENKRLRAALEKIACLHVTRDQLWWQNEARRALEGDG